MKSTTSESGQNTTKPTETNSVFRTKTDTEELQPLPETNSEQPIGTDSDIAPTKGEGGLFIGYEIDNGVPLVADYYGIKDTYSRNKETFPEVADITSYLHELVRSGELDNTSKAAREKLKSLEKLAGVDNTERVNMKLIRLAEFAKFQNRVNLAKLSR